MADERMVLRIPVCGSPVEDVILKGLFPMTQEKWDQFKAVLNAMEPALIEVPTKETDRG